MNCTNLLVSALTSNIASSVYSGVILILISIFFRVFVFKPKIKLTDLEVSKVRHTISNNGQSVLRHWVNLKFVNAGLQKMNQPKVYCLRLRYSTENTDIGLPPVNLKWRGVGTDGSLDHMFPINVDYQAGLGFFDFVIDSRGVYDFFLETLILDAKIEETEAIQIENFVTYNALLVVGNGNFLVPPHYIELEFLWKPSKKGIPGEVPVYIDWTIKSQGTIWGLNKKIYK